MFHASQLRPYHTLPAADPVDVLDHPADVGSSLSSADLAQELVSGPYPRVLPVRGSVGVAPASAEDNVDVPALENVADSEDDVPVVGADSQVGPHLVAPNAVAQPKPRGRPAGKTAAKPMAVRKMGTLANPIPAPAPQPADSFDDT